ncbi:MAG: hypothetical protein AB7N76_27260 [Planctomycetota bacterium]
MRRAHRWLLSISSLVAGTGCAAPSPAAPSDPYPPRAALVRIGAAGPEPRQLVLADHASVLFFNDTADRLVSSAARARGSSSRAPSARRPLARSR